MEKPSNFVRNEHQSNLEKNEPKPEESDGERLIQNEILLLEKFRSGKTWKAARALLLISFLSAGGTYYYNKKDGGTDRDAESTPTEQVVTKQNQKILTETEYRNLLDTDIRAALRLADLYKNEPWAQDIVKDSINFMIKNDPISVLISAPDFRNYSWASEKTREAVLVTLKRHPVLALEYAENYKAQPWGIEMLKDAVIKTTEKNPGEALENARAYKSELWGPELLKMVVEKNIEKNPRAAIAHASVYKNERLWGKEKLRQAVEKVFIEDPVYLIYSSKSYRAEPWGEAILKKSVEWAIENRVDEALSYANNFKNEIWGRVMVKRAVDRAINTDYKSLMRHGNVLQEDSSIAYKCKVAFDRAFQEGELRMILYNIEGYLNHPWAKKELERTVKKAAITDPRSAIEVVKLYYKEQYVDEIMSTVFKRDPLLVFDTSFRGGMSLKGMNDPSLRIIAKIIESGHKNNVRMNMVVLLDKIIKDKITLEEAAEIAQSPARLFEEVLKIKAQSSPLGEISLEKWLKGFSLRNIREINDLHERPDAERFKSVEKAESKALYTLMVYGEEEVFTSTFSGLFNRLIKTMKEEKINGGQLLDKTGNLRFRSFVRLMAGFNKLNEFLNTMENADRVALLQKFAQNIEKEENPLSQAVAVADVFSTVQDPAILKVFQETIKQEYERVQAGDKNAKVIYGLLAGMFSKKVVINEEWTREITKEYKLPDVMEISSQELFNRDGSNVQRYFFYNDEDGHASYSNFLAQYKDKGDWAVETKDTYVLIVSKRGDKKIEIYANKPSKEDEGQEAIQKELVQRKIESIMVVHRGHSYHVGKTIRNIPPIAKIVSLGSCGGYNNIDGVLKMAPEAHIISTKGVGTMTVNDPLFKMINERIVQGQNLNWTTLWKDAEHKFGANRDFANYVPPHKNLGVLFLKAFNQLKKD